MALHLQLRDLLRVLHALGDPLLSFADDEREQAIILRDEGFEMMLTVEAVNSTEYFIAFPITPELPEDESRVQRHLLELTTDHKLILSIAQTSAGHIRYGVGTTFRWEKQDTSLTHNFTHALLRLRDFKDENYDDLIHFIDEGDEG